MKKVFILYIILYSLLYSQGHYATVNKLIPNIKEDSIISIGKDEQIIIWNLKKYEAEKIVEVNKGSLEKGVVMVNRGYLVTSNKAGLLYFFSMSTNTLIDIKNPNTGQILDIYSYSQDKLLIISKMGEILLYDYAKDNIEKRIKLDNYLTASFLAKDYIYVANEDASIKRINKRYFELETFELQLHQHQVNNLLLDGNLLLATSWDSDLVAYDTLKDEEVFRLGKFKEGYIVDFLKVEEKIYIAFSTGTISTYDIATKVLKESYKLNSGIVDIDVIEDTLIVALEDSTISFINLVTQEVIKKNDH